MIADAINEEAGGAYHYVYDRHDVARSATPTDRPAAVRGGSIVGEHEVLFCGPDEVITLSHSQLPAGCLPTVPSTPPYIWPAASPACTPWLTCWVT